MATKPPSTRRKLVRAAIQQLESLEAAGLTHLPNAKPGRIKPAAAGPAAARAAVAKPLSMTASAIGPTASQPPAGPRQPAALPAAANPRPTSPAAGEEKVAALAELRGGLPSAGFATSWRPPGRKPFLARALPARGWLFWARRPAPTKIGPAGLLWGRPGSFSREIIEACGLKREDVYIFNTLKCRPPGNRNSTSQRSGQLPAIPGSPIGTHSSGVHLLPGSGGGAESVHDRRLDRPAPRPGP